MTHYHVQTNLETFKTHEVRIHLYFVWYLMKKTYNTLAHANTVIFKIWYGNQPKTGKSWSQDETLIPRFGRLDRPYGRSNRDPWGVQSPGLVWRLAFSYEVLMLILIYRIVSTVTDVHFVMFCVVQLKVECDKLRSRTCAEVRVSPHAAFEDIR